MASSAKDIQLLSLIHIFFKALVGGFTTVTIASVVFAGIIVPMIF